jgi:hypothetical protein
MAIQINRAPRTALGRDQHDIAPKRLKVDLVLAATTGFEGDAEALPSNYRRFIEPALHVLRRCTLNERLLVTAQPLQ